MMEITTSQNGLILAEKAGLQPLDLMVINQSQHCLMFVQKVNLKPLDYDENLEILTWFDSGAKSKAFGS